jgi:hypothetical protein
VAIINFLTTFEVQRTLLYPHLYRVLEDVARELVRSMLEPELFALYLRELLSNKLAAGVAASSTTNTRTRTNTHNNPLEDVDPCELFLLRVLCQMLQDTTLREEVNP